MLVIYLIQFALRKIHHECESESGLEKSANIERVSGISMLEICEYALVSFLVVIRVWREIWHEMLSNDKEGRQNERVGQREAREQEGKGARAESSEVHVSQYLSHPKLDFRNSSWWERGFQTARFAAGLLAPCLPSRHDSKIHLNIRCIMLRTHGCYQINALLFSTACFNFHVLSVLFKELMVNFRSFLNYTLSIY